MNSPAETDMDTCEAAGFWDARLRAPDCSDADRAEHEEWKSADPANAQAFNGLQKMIKDLPTIALMPEVQSMRSAALSRSQESAAPTPNSTRWSFASKAFAASVAAVAMTALLVMQTGSNVEGVTHAVNDHTPVFETAVGDRTDIPLTDGTIATLNTDSEIDVRYGLDERAIHLTRGEAHFDVAHNPDRPFVVYAGDYKVIAVGTAFDVRTLEDTVDVTVLEGKVEVKRIDQDDREGLQRGAMLVAGQKLSVRQAGPALRRQANLSVAASWRNGNAVFEDTPLMIAVQEMNRYSDVKLTISDYELANTEINGVFIAGRQDSFVAALEAYFGVTATHVSGTEIHLEPSAR